MLGPDGGAISGADLRLMRCRTGLHSTEAMLMKKPVLNLAERECPACKGTGVAAVKQPTRPGVRIYPPRCTVCLGKGRIAN
jgi:DnaJ-class molecular chaperone